MTHSHAHSDHISTATVMTIVFKNKTIDINDEMIVQTLKKLANEPTSAHTHDELYLTHQSVKEAV